MADIPWGTGDKIEFGDTDSSVIAVRCVEIDTDKFVVVWADADDGYKGKARVGTRSGTVITWGAISTFSVGDTFNTGAALGVCKIDTDKFIVVFADGGAADDGFVRLATVSTRTITWGAQGAVEFHDTDTEYPSCTLIDTNKFAIVYDDETSGDLGTVVICTIDNDPDPNTIHPGTPVAFEGRLTVNRCCKLDTDKLVSFYRDTGDGGKGKACVFTVSGTTPTPGTIKEIDAAASSNCDCCQLDTDKFALVWIDQDGGTGEIEICTVSDGTISEGGQVEFDPATPGRIGIDKVDSSHLVIVYEDTGNNEYGTSRLCSFTGDTVSLDGEEIFSAAKMAYPDVCLINTDVLVAVYQDDADANDIGEAVIGGTAAAIAGIQDKAGSMAAKLMSRGML